MITAAAPSRFTSLQHRLEKPLVRSAATENGGVVVSQCRAASEIGAAVLRRGGNAMDAAIATGFAMGVAEPWMSGIGGGGALVHRRANGEVTVIDFGMRTPKSLDPADYPLADTDKVDFDLFGWPEVVENRNLCGPMAIAVPGYVAGMAMALEKLGSGSIAWDEVVLPAAELAREGLPADWFSLMQIAGAEADLRRFPASAGWFLPEDGRLPGPPVRGLSLPNMALAATLTRLAEAGPQDFYTGQIAESLSADIRAAGGSLSMADLAAYAAREKQPLLTERRGLKLFTPPGLTGGITLSDALTELGQDRASPANVAAALKAAFAKRLSTFGDQPGHDPEGKAEDCTTHISVVDGQGNMVSLTQTLLSIFGSRYTAPGTGILMNNGINWFDPRPGRPNSLAPDKRPLANYCPVICAIPKSLDLGPALAMGGAGGRRILGAVMQALLKISEEQLSPEQAISAPRIDVSGGQVVVADPRLPEADINALQAQNDVAVHPVAPNPPRYAILGVAGGAPGNTWGAADPVHPWAEACSI